MSTKYITSRLESDRLSKKNAGRFNRRQLMAWVGAKRSPQSTFKNEIWQWITATRKDDEIVAEIEWGRGQPNNYNQDQDCAVIDSELNWGWNDLSCRISAVAICSGRPSHCSNPPVNEGVLLTNPPDGDSWRVGDIATYFCPIGEMPVGEKANRKCQKDGAWSGDNSGITCKSVECGKPPGVANTDGIHLLDGRTSWGARVRYKCKQDYSLMNGSEERVCEENGWSGNQPECVYTRCSEPSSVAHARVQNVGNPHQPKNSLGSKLVYTCDDGYRPIGSQSRECLIGGKWSGESPRCEFVE